MRQSASLQIPFLLNIAASTTIYLESFPFSPRSTFDLLRKLDLAFSSLLKGTDPDTGSTLSGFETGRRMTVTENVRLRGIVERTRIQLAKAGSGENIREVEATQSEMSDTDLESRSDDFLGEQNDWGMEVARVFEKTLMDLGTNLDEGWRSPDVHG